MRIVRSFAGVVAAVCLFSAGAVLSSCSGQQGCQAGGASSEDAVNELLLAAVDRDVDRACRVTTRLPEDDLMANLQEISEFIATAGGYSALSVREDESRQMGAEHLVAVAVTDSPAVVWFSVLQEGKKYLVGIGEDSPYNNPIEPTTNPGPRPSTAASLGPSEAA